MGPGAGRAPQEGLAPAWPRSQMPQDHHAAPELHPGVQGDKAGSKQLLTPSHKPSPENLGVTGLEKCH